MMKTCFEFTLALLAINLILIAPTSGYFDATLTSTRFLYQNDTSFMNSAGLRVQRVKRTYIMTGSFELFVDADDGYEVISYFSKKAGNEYKRMAYKLGPNKFCQYFDNDKYFTESFRQASDLPAKGTCPWPKMTYTIYNYTINLSAVPPIVSSGDYVMETQFLKDGTLLNALQFYVKLEHI